ncbi:hypothetical protein [Gudongella oleilytica]|jgi:hypothetical protein|uniref:hypothetical protein n=1 Tax=Gudongella oleilytica TaxID=1582259 RepID=UPI000FF8A3E0|nr:hypothetical protein [Gudongella oleilytica]MDY0256465.1 hypothetical protein [Gudongella oleilytica]HMM69318.1 hypothetical protein [Gudongella oleilytica]
MKFKRTTAALGIVLALAATGMAYSEPGTESDPLISLSYLEERLDELKDYIDSKVGSTGEQVPSIPSDNSLAVVELFNGQMLIGDAGSEIILRSGSATAITSPSGGLSDVTAGTDIAEGKPIPANHLLIIPRSDGRGIFVTKNSTFVMVRGGYTIR